MPRLFSCERSPSPVLESTTEWPDSDVAHGVLLCHDHLLPLHRLTRIDWAEFGEPFLERGASIQCVEEASCSYEGAFDSRADYRLRSYLDCHCGALRLLNRVNDCSKSRRRTWNLWRNENSEVVQHSLGFCDSDPVRGGTSSTCLPSILPSPYEAFSWYSAG